jgi:hypothetical protein
MTAIGSRDGVDNIYLTFSSYFKKFEDSQALPYKMMIRSKEYDGEYSL